MLSFQDVVPTCGSYLTMEVAALRYNLGDNHTYEFIEGNIPCSIAPGMITSILG